MKKKIIGTVASLVMILNVVLFSFNYEVNASEALYGDVNGDGKVDIDDMLLLEKGLEGWKVTIDRDLADVYKDGKINNRDLTVLKRHIAGEKMFEQLPYERK